MFTQLICLREFLEFAPVCLQTEELRVVVDLFSQGAWDRLVIVDAQQQPVGLIHLRSLAPHLARRLTASLADSDLNQPLTQLAIPLVEPLPTLPIELPLQQCSLDLTTGPRLWAVMENGIFQGLLDSFYLQKLLHFTGASQGVAPPPRAPVSPARSPKQTASSALQTPLFPADVDRFKAQLRAQIVRLRSQAQARQALVDQLEQQPQNWQGTEAAYQRETDILATLQPSGSEATTVPVMAAWVQCLQRLPLPLMLQTHTGKVLAQNSAWLQQFGELVDPSWVRRDAAIFLEPESAPDWQETGAGWQQSPRSSLTSLCQIGSTPNTCVCVCPLKNGQERIVQFIKIPLGCLTPGMDLELVESWQRAEGVERSLDHFRLATLEQTTYDPWAIGDPKPAASTSESLWLVLAQDVTEQQQLAKELAAKNADLVQLNRLKDEFLACISHELRTPLTSVLGLSSLLKDQLLGELNERQVRYAQLIYRSGRHLMAIVNDILDLTRMETGQVALVPEPIDIPSVCTRAFEQAKQIRLVEAKPDTQQSEEDLLPTPSFSLEIEPGLDSFIADEVRLRQMLVNLLSNALKFTEATGQVGLRVSQWDGWVAFTIWDTGIGIPADKQHLIFQKFQQLENPLTRRFEGAGLGLVLTQRLARLHGGDVTFVSRENQGSQFTLLLPPTQPLDRDTATELAAFQRASPIIKPPNRLVLIVEAVMQFIDHLTEQLSKLGYRIVIARSGTEALEKTRRLQPCAVFLNPRLPMLSGWDVLTLLKADAETRHIPVVITTTQVDQEQAHRNQADGFLSLPIASLSLQHTLTRLTVPSNPTPMAVGKGSLVVLRLSPNRYSRETQEITELNNLLHQHNYRVLEVDDLEQADLLARVWQPKVVLLAGSLTDPLSYLRQFAEYPFLAALPLITLDPTTTQAANQIPELLVFPCLAPLAEQFASLSPHTTALLQVIQVATGLRHDRASS